MKIPIAQPLVGEEEARAVADVLRSGMLAQGSVVTEFEDRFAEYCGVSHAVGVNSGTAALHAALLAAGIGPGDSVIVPAFTFFATASCVSMCGATPLFADVDPRTFNIDPDSVSSLIGPKTRAIIAVDLFGQPFDLRALRALCDDHDLVLIEDAAQAHGAEYHGRRAGSLGDLSCFSFYPTKNMTTTEGGMVLTSDETIAKKARMLINHGMQVRYYHDEIGYNYRMTNMAAAIGLCQLKKLDSFNAKRRETAAYYNANIKNPLVQTPASYEKGTHVYHQYTVKIREDKRDAFIAHLEQNGIGYGVFYPLSIPEQKCYIPLGINTPCPVTDIVKKKVVSLPVHPQLTAQEAEAVVQCVNSFRG